MKQTTLNQWTIVDSQDTHLLTWVEAFLFDRKAQGLSKGKRIKRPLGQNEY